MKTLRVAVIGAGAAGLCAARHITAKPNMTPVVFEKASTVGGVWCYTEKTYLDDHGLKVHSAMYKNLRTNLPKEVMKFPDFPFDENFPSFMTHEQVQQYLTSYSKEYQLEKFIKFETLVRHVKPVTSSSGNKWEITYEDLKEKTTSTTIFDAVFICNGHYAKPHIPSFPGDEHFKGLKIHSHSYRHPEMFSGKKVLVLGCKSSGQDISLDVAKNAESVVISHRTQPITSVLPENVTQAPSITSFKEDGVTVTFQDGSECKADAFIYCTGYQYNFPFLDESSDIAVDSGRICYLYHHLINPSHPTMMFIGVCGNICPFPQFHFQILYCLATLDGSLELPSKEEMMNAVQRDYDNRLEMGLPHRQAHKMAAMQWEYNNFLADAINVPKLHPSIQRLYEDVTKSRSSDLCNYKNYRMKTLEDGFYQVCKV